MGADRIKAGQELYDSGIIPKYNNDGTFSIAGKSYKFHDTHCNCMDNNTRKPSEGCKHMNYIRIWLTHNKDPRSGEIENMQIKFKDIIEHMKNKGETANCEDLYDLFGSELVDDAISHNVIVKTGRMFILIL
jgi:hypothetical protein